MWDHLRCVAALRLAALSFSLWDWSPDDPPIARGGLVSAAATGGLLETDFRGMCFKKRSLVSLMPLELYY